MELPAARPGAVALLSGGVDSAVMAALALERGDAIWPLYVRQGFVWEDEEIGAVRLFLASFRGENAGRIAPLVCSTLGAPGNFPVPWALDPALAAPEITTPDEDVYLPGRNLALLTQAAQLAYSVGARRIMLGILSGNPFPDATPRFFAAFEAVVAEAMRWRIRIERPLAMLTKIEVIELGAGHALGLTLSCMRPRGGRHCGRCSKCNERWVAFRQAGIPDPAPYAADSLLKN